MNKFLKENWNISLADLVLLFVISILVLFLVFVIPVTLIYDGNVRDEARDTCIKNGYPETLFANHEYYCKRTVNGTDEIVPIKELIE